jgi:hypothetical protein
MASAFPRLLQIVSKQSSNTMSREALHDIGLTRIS